MEFSQNRLEWISNLFQSVEPVYLWCFNEEGIITATTSPEDFLPDEAFDIRDWRQCMLRHFKQTATPYIIGSPFGIVWIAVIDKSALPQINIIVLGPVSTSTISQTQLWAGEKSSRQLYQGKAPFQSIMRSFEKAPVISPNMIQRYTIMLHYAVNSEKIDIGEIRFRKNSDDSVQKAWEKTRDRHKNYHAEQALIQAVRNGDINYTQQLSAAQSVGKGIAVTSSDSLRSLKNTVIIFTTLCSRAAIEGGLSPNEAYTVGDRYIQEAENSRSMSELVACNHTMLDDFVHRVHSKRVNPKLSPQIQSCCDYIELHCEEKLRIRDIAQYIGYTEYYLSKRFKQETGETVNDFIKVVKIERSKMLLTTTDLDIGDIAAQLSFSSRGYFSEVFTQVVGMSPAQYRKKYKLV